MRIYKKHCYGFTFIELIISSAVSVITIASLISFFGNSISNNVDTLKQIHLNQQLRVLIDVMARDIRRAGYWSLADGYKPNPFMNGSAALTISDDKTCITYSYDNNSGDPNIVQKKDKFGFRLLKDSIKFRQNSASCDKTKNWITMSENENIKINNLNLVISSNCKFLQDPKANCHIDDNISKSISHTISIQINGELAHDSNIKQDMTRTVVIRNSTII